MLKPNKNQPSEFCRRSKSNLHTYEPIRDTDKIQVEVCTRCGTKAMYNKVGGRIDSERYRRDHLADYLQNSPNSPTFGLYLRHYGRNYAKEQMAKSQKHAEEENQQVNLNDYR